MVAIYRRQMPQKAQLARKKIADSKKNRTCPACGTFLQLAESGKDRDTYYCSKCNSTATFTISPVEEPKNSSTKFKTFSIHDKSKTTKHPEKDKPEQEETANVADSVNTVREGMGGRNLVSFEYLDTQGNKSTRMVEPYKLTRTGGQIVLYGYDVEAQGIRVFKLSRAHGLKKQSYSFSPRWPVEDKLVKKSDGNKS
jgi:ribosomal protein S27AE